MVSDDPAATRSRRHASFVVLLLFARNPFAAPLVLASHPRARAVPPRRRAATVCRGKSGGPPAIKSRFFEPLSTPGNLTAALESAPRDSISVVKYQAPWCRTCRATAPLLESTSLITRGTRMRHDWTTL